MSWLPYVDLAYELDTEARTGAGLDWDRGDQGGNRQRGARAMRQRDKLKSEGGVSRCFGCVGQGFGMSQSDDVRYLESLLARLRAWWRRRRAGQPDQPRTNDQSQQ